MLLERLDVGIAFGLSVPLRCFPGARWSPIHASAARF
jgi:hypothetical protein